MVLTADQQGDIVDGKKAILNDLPVLVAVRARCKQKCPCGKMLRYCILSKEAAQWHGHSSNFLESRSKH
jgi:hypothetical protein